MTTGATGQQIIPPPYLHFMPKKSFALRIDEKTMKAVEKWAADEFRSVNGQLEWMITNMLREANRLKVNKEKEKDVNTTSPKTPPANQ